MKIKKLHQTLENRENPDEIESNGPFPCNKRTAWLGNGYYFWDTFIELAHWWGKQGYDGSYIICQADCNNDTDKIFDLVGNTEHLNELEEYKRALDKVYQQKKMTVSAIIEHMKKYSGNFNYEAIRASGVNTVKCDSTLLKRRILFNQNNSAYLDMRPPIQICIINKTGLRLKDYHVIYPEEYCANFTI